MSESYTYRFIGSQPGDYVPRQRFGPRTIMDDSVLSVDQVWAADARLERDYPHLRESPLNLVHRRSPGEKRLIHAKARALLQRLRGQEFQPEYLNKQARRAGSDLRDRW